MNRIYTNEDIIEYLEEIKQDYSQKSPSSTNYGYIDVIDYVVDKLKHYDKICAENCRLRGSNKGLRLCKYYKDYGNSHIEEIISYFHKWINEDSALIEFAQTGEVFVVKAEKIQFLDNEV